jgi:gamma-glutamyltranspeptidase/glutathione hydrolase
MSPVIVLHQGRPVLVDGGSGGPTIITGVLQATVDALDFHLDPAAAVAEPRIHHQAQPSTVFVEAGMPQPTVRALAHMGYQIKTVPELGAVNQISIAPGKLSGAFDPRKGGGAAGD